ncbi:cob(I)yrinic acid a,c-diamide adenosyltransferase [Gammaproteobacteria bacterium AB-CW1]|uniref:Corrinoid adenosyltransferase n=1 Tax=Natronospira elongata TaxID=3110268 RepID=A0AAP6MMF8_9GAMM|nr:cob(I)yrinic acid a,c-diamide adenosyltransferase [Gammaproteobacteria bacterium AB-CW1]
MGKRLSKIYTRTGDHGTTGLGDGSRVPKDHPRVAAYGTTDELNSIIGMVLAEDLPDSLREPLIRIQHDLFDLGGELCVPGWTAITPGYTERLEQSLDALNADLPALEDFILPGGGRATAACHLARTVCRRAERAVWTLKGEEDINPEVARYLNRLSDWLFVAARVLARHEQGEEVIWQKGYSQGAQQD